MLRQSCNNLASKFFGAEVPPEDPVDYGNSHSPLEMFHQHTAFAGAEAARKAPRIRDLWRFLGVSDPTLDKAAWEFR